MFKLIDSAFLTPVRYPVKPEVKLTPGTVVCISDYNGCPVVDICNGNGAFALCGIRYQAGNCIDFKKLALIYPQRAVINISKYDRKSVIKIGSSLYCNESGELTADKPFENSIILAKVITPSNSEKKNIQILWL